MKFVEDINQAFAEIILRQMKVDQGEDHYENKDQQDHEGDLQIEQEPLGDQVVYGKRILVDLIIGKTIREICEESKKLVPEPIWPDPDREPLPPPVIHQIVKKPPNRNERTPITLF